jgi:hypothetical protein
MVTTALFATLILFGTRCVTPSPAHVSSAVILAECVTVVVFVVVPHAKTAAVTVTTTDPLFVASAVLVAVMVNVPAAVGENVAVRPLAVTDPDGATVQVTVPVQL